MINVNTRSEPLNCLVPNVVALAAATKTLILPDRRDDGSIYVYRYIQNLTGGDLYLSFDVDVDFGNTKYHMVLANGSQLTVPTVGFVSGYSAGGGNVATAEFTRVRL